MCVKAYVLKSLIFLFVFVIGLSLGAFALASAGNLLNQSLAPAPQYPMNASGETYGSLLYATSPETEPNLVKAMGVDGTIGYVRNVDLNGVPPKTPEEAIAQQEKMSDTKRIPLYKSDGKTVIGEYEITKGVVTGEKSVEGQ